MSANEIERKFRVENFGAGMIPATATPSLIIQDYLVCEGPGERRVRKRVYGDGETVFSYAEKLPTADSMTRVENERVITELEYLQYLASDRDPSLWTIEKTRYNFPYDGKLYELDVYDGRRVGLVVLEVELQHKGEEVRIPPNWEVVEVTDDERYKNRRLAAPAARK